MSKLFKASLLIAAGFFCALMLQRNGAYAERRDVAATQAGMNLPVQDLRLFSEVLGIIRQNYVEPVSDSDLIKNAIRGMLSGLDPHSAYLDKEDFQELKEGTSGEFGGLGIEVGMEDGFVKVVSPIDDTPAQKAGVRSGDLIIRLDDTAVKGLSLNEAVKLMRGAPGTDITLTIVREGVERPLQIKLTRAVIKVNSVRSRELQPGYEYLRVSQFQTNTGRKLRDAVNELKDKNGGHLKGLVLDLRNNPGGVLTAAVSVADAFLSDGLIVYTEGRAPESEQRFSATAGDIVDGVPIVVLVNAGSASASEIVAGVGSGLGGGSADAAAVAGALLAHWKMDKDDIIGFDRIMLGLGADVPVCLRDKATIVRGKGEDLSDLPSELPPVYALLVYPGAPCSTADVFKRHNGKAGKSYDLAAWPRRGVFLNALRECRNDLTDAASAMTPEINTAMKELSQYDDCKIVRMSGSGSTCFALFTDQKKMIDIAHKIRTQYPQWWIQTTGLH